MSIIFPMSINSVLIRVPSYLRNVSAGSIRRKIRDLFYHCEFSQKGTLNYYISNSVSLQYLVFISKNKEPFPTKYNLKDEQFHTLQIFLASNLGLFSLSAGSNK